MAAKTVAGTSKFHIYSSFTLSMDDASALALLYAPLIGNDAFALYMELCSLLERNNLKSEEILHQDLFDIYSLKPQDFLQSRIKLEGIGLLITYEKNGDYIYVLCPPLSPKNFIKDTTYGLYLYSKMRREAFYFLKKHFEIERPDVEEYTNITSAFDDVFTSKVDNDATLEKFSYILGKNSTNYLTIKNADFDFDSFVKEINTDYLEGGVTKSFEKQIINLAYVYDFDEKQMASLYMDSVNKANYFDYRILKKKANTLFIYLRNMNAPKLMVKTDNAVPEKEGILSFLENASPAVILEGINPKYSPKYLETVNEIYASIDLPRGVLNCMIIKTMQDKGGELPGIAYFKRVAESWMRDSVLSTEDAIKYVSTMKEKPATQKQKQDEAFTSTKNAEIIWEEL